MMKSTVKMMLLVFFSLSLAACMGTGSEKPLARYQIQ